MKFLEHLCGDVWSQIIAAVCILWSLTLVAIVACVYLAN